jgi:hypothetical protein
VPVIRWLAFAGLVSLGLAPQSWAQASGDVSRPYQICAPNMNLADAKYSYPDQYRLKDVWILDMETGTYVSELNSMGWREAVFGGEGGWTISLGRREELDASRLKSIEFSADFLTLALATNPCDMLAAYMYDTELPAGFLLPCAPWGPAMDPNYLKSHPAKAPFDRPT